MPHCTAHSTTGTCPNQTIFAKNRWRVGPNSEGTASGCSDSHKVAENKKREAGDCEVDR